ncbi:MAG TPA: tetratricopeptide repeat protein [Candidatus Kapabacteria bacterium]|nr:tetratricopeptide repeat protein [Candidatus Kapabacteria bacterium]
MKALTNIENLPPKEKAQEYLQRAYKLQMAGKLDEAIENYETSISILPTAEAHTFLGWAYSFLGNYDKAIDECKMAIDIDPDFGNPYNDIGAYLIQSGDTEEAIPFLELAMKAKRYATPHFPHYNLGRILERRGDWFEALGEYEEALELEPSYTLAKDAYYRLLSLMN